MHTDATTVKREFANLRKSYLAGVSAFTTVVEEEERTADREVATAAAKLTVTTLVKDNADLQLSFGNAVAQLETNLQNEVEKIDNIQRAVEVESAELTLLRNILVAAEAIAIQKQEQTAATAKFEEQKDTKISEFDEQLASTRSTWETADTKFDEDAVNFQSNLETRRTRTAKDRVYEVSNRANTTQTRFDYDLSSSTRQFNERTARREKEWTSRTAVLDTAAEEIADLKTQVEEFPAKETKAETTARESAISRADTEHKFEMALLTQAAETRKTIDENTIKSLNEGFSAGETRINALEDSISDIENQTNSLATTNATDAQSK